MNGWWLHAAGAGRDCARLRPGEPSLDTNANELLRDDEAKYCMRQRGYICAITLMVRLTIAGAVSERLLSVAPRGLGRIVRSRRTGRASGRRPHSPLDPVRAVPVWRWNVKMIAPVSLAALTIAPALVSGDTAEVVKQGQHGIVKLEHVVAGHLSELNGRYKLRVTEVTYDPAGFIGDHHHAGPGIRCVTAGELTYTQSEKTTVYRSGDCFFESGDVTHSASNQTERPVVLLNFELLPAHWAEGSAIPVPR